MWRSASRLAAALLLAACGGGGGTSGTTVAPGPCRVDCGPPLLGVGDNQRIIAQAVAEAQARGVRAHIAIVDRVGNVLAVFSMTGAPQTIAISSQPGAAPSGTGSNTVHGGLDGIAQGTIPATFSAITKAITGAYLSSNGNAFSTRTASQIVQEHFNPNEAHQPSGPLYGVQFSQLPCSDVNQFAAPYPTGPKRSPLGLSADPGGLPLYKNGALVGGIGIEADGLYTLDRDITDFDENDEELIAVAGSFGFSAPADIRGDRITADGRTFRYVDSESLRSMPSQAPAFASLPGSLVTVSGYKSFADIIDGVPYGYQPSGTRLDTATFAAQGGWIVVDYVGDRNRYPPRASADGTIAAADVQAILSQALAIAQRARGQIRRPLGSNAQVSISIVDRNGDILGLVRTSDAPLFGIDVAVQKARTALFFSHPGAAAELAVVPAAQYVNGTSVSISAYGEAFRSFTGTALDGSVAFTPRAVGNLHRPFFPDGLENSPNGPLSKPYSGWSVFNVGFQLDIVYNQLVKALTGDGGGNCTAIPKLRNGAQIFPGGVPIYRDGNLVGAIGVSGDGVDQDDMIAYLSVENVARAGGRLTNAPRERRADTLAPLGVRLRYVQCPQSPFNDSTEQNVCD